MNDEEYKRHNEMFIQALIVLGIVASCVISSAVSSIIESCEPTIGEQCREACGAGNVRSVSETVCECKVTR